MQLVMAAMTTWPWSRSKLVPSSRATGTRLVAGRWPRWGRARTSRPVAGRGCSSLGRSGHGRRRVAGRERLGRGLVRPVLATSGRPARPRRGSGAMSARAARKPRRASVRATRSWGRRGPARLGHHRGQVELDRLGVAGLGGRVVPQALLLGVRLDQGDQLGRAAGEAQVAQGLGVDREDGAGRPVLGRHVADGGPVLERHVADPGAVELDELAHHAVAAQQLGDGQHQVGGGRALGQLARQLERRPPRASASRCGWPSMAASASIPPTPQPSTPRPLTIGVWESVPTRVSG